MKKYLKIIIVLIIIVLAITAVFFSIKTQKNEKRQLLADGTTDNIKNPAPITPIDLCYYRSDKTSRGFYDKAWLKLKLQGDAVTGEFYNLPPESDSKVGDFTGSVGPLDQAIMARHADVWWNSRAEGMEVKEQLSIQFGDGSATAGFGEMVDRGDGVYVYKDASKLYWIKGMSQTDCDSIDEKLVVEQYVKDSIGTIAINKPVLGGTWYVLSANINSGSKTGEVMYEDGHIQSKATFSYLYNKDAKSVQITKFEIVK